jgi:uncharacterized membrane protein YedE/YeeE
MGSMIPSTMEFVSGLCGIVFGFAIEKGQVYLPSVIQNQMLFSQFIMLKMFLSAVATSKKLKHYNTVAIINILFETAGASVFAVLSVIPATKAYFKSAVDAYRVGLDSLSTSKSIVGGAMIGIGMTLSGAVSIETSDC